MKRKLPVGALCLTFVLAASCPEASASTTKLSPSGTVQASAAGAALMDTISGDVERGAQSFIDSLSQQASAFLADKTLSQDQKLTHFTSLLESSFDMNTISRFALGRYWRAATPEERREYQDLFRQMVLKVYSEKFDEYQGQDFSIRGVRAEGQRDAIVTSSVIPENGPEIQVDWRVRYKDGRYKVVDVMVEGVSMTVTQRSDFAAVIQRGGGQVSTLLDHLRQH